MRYNYIKPIYKTNYLIKNRLINYLEENNLLPVSRHGVRKGLGANNVLENLTKEIYDNLDKHSQTMGIFLDLSKSFNSISHAILLKNLKNYFGITVKAYCTYNKSYLKGMF
jgi:hypothetical protein